MKKILLAIFVVLFCCSLTNLLAQESVGFSNPEDIQPLLDYRLPDWGYSNFGLDLSHMSSVSDSKYDQRNISRFSNTIQISPTYRLYRESEQKILNLFSSVGLNYNNSKIESRGYDNSERQTKNLNIDSQINISLKNYQSENIFLYGAGDFSVTYNRRKNFQPGNTSIGRDVSIKPEIGIGFGRIRNINPMIRAVRLEERLRAIGQDALNRVQLLNAANQFTKYDGYQKSYDRSEKYFWQDMNRATGSALSGLKPYDMMYLTDIFDEVIGTRFEGWELIAGVRFRYTNYLDRKDQDSSQGSTSIIKTIGPYLRGRLYHNISLNHQIGAFGSLNQSYPLGSSNSAVDYNWNASTTLGVEWLWTVSDRWFLNTEVRNRYSRIKRTIANDLGSGNSTRWTNNLSLSSYLTYFLENKLAITVRFTPFLYHRRGITSDSKIMTREFDINMSVDVKYYFIRNLY
ncbi:hypothetical protein NC796_08880 [Aliifodinibius sp. S!AR15-10]|uniref:hypothetical protein n=1 Tax=Aliifodinibius sp. S!AR15-10 TaxID=2950437 RepID=UPI002858E3F5|nr:hypothetical protein [Aliifodinibius sp. S!AR15-10]MDR8391250.1 hypothetical protein [Aliifodinibius sp. S!AR15-10]